MAYINLSDVPYATLHPTAKLSSRARHDGKRYECLPRMRKESQGNACVKGRAWASIAWAELAAPLDSTPNLFLFSVAGHCLINPTACMVGILELGSHWAVAFGIWIVKGTHQDR